MSDNLQPSDFCARKTHRQAPGLTFHVNMHERNERPDSSALDGWFSRLPTANYFHLIFKNHVAPSYEDMSWFFRGRFISHDSLSFPPLLSITRDAEWIIGSRGSSFLFWEKIRGTWSLFSILAHPKTERCPKSKAGLTVVICMESGPGSSPPNQGLFVCFCICFKTEPGALTHLLITLLFSLLI